MNGDSKREFVLTLAFARDFGVSRSSATEKHKIMQITENRESPK